MGNRAGIFGGNIWVIGREYLEGILIRGAGLFGGNTSLMEGIYIGGVKEKADRRLIEIKYIILTILDGIKPAGWNRNYY